MGRQSHYHSCKSSFHLLLCTPSTPPTLASEWANNPCCFCCSLSVSCSAVDGSSQIPLFSRTYTCNTRNEGRTIKGIITLACPVHLLLYFYSSLRSLFWLLFYGILEEKTFSTLQTTKSRICNYFSFPRPAILLAPLVVQHRIITILLSIFREGYPMWLLLLSLAGLVFPLFHSSAVINKTRIRQFCHVLQMH